MKSIGHSTMVVSEVVTPYLDNPLNQSWRAPLLAYRSQMESALKAVDAADMPTDWRDDARAILRNNIAFMDKCVANGAITMANLQDFAKIQASLLKSVIAWAAET